MEAHLNDPLPQELLQIHRNIIQHYTPKSGWCDANGCPTCRDAEALIDRKLSEATRAYYDRGITAVEDPKALQHAYDVGFLDGKRNGIQTGKSLARTQIQAAYQRGVADGSKAATCPTCAAGSSSSSSAKDFYDKVLNECHVIGESNPQMKPAMNALRHRIKKLSR
jgi:hypothetical protein